MSPRLLQWENWELEGLSFFLNVMSVQGTSALRTQTKIVENTTLMGAHTCTRQLVLDQHNKSQCHHGLQKLHLVSKNLRKRKTKSLSGGNETLATETLATQATSKLSFNRRTSLPFVETDDKKRFPCLYIVWNNKSRPSFLEFNCCKDKR